MIRIGVLFRRSNSGTLWGCSGGPFRIRILLLGWGYLLVVTLVTTKCDDVSQDGPYWSVLPSGLALINYEVPHACV